ncbi:MAG: hypothetical protein AABZ02_02210 [Bacteroidota bacterium]
MHQSDGACGGPTIMAATGLGDRLKVAEVQKTDVQAFLSKPFTAEKLLTTVYEALKPKP